MISIVEELILNPDALKCDTHPDRMKGWRRYRIEYGFECGCREGVIYLPPNSNAQYLEEMLELEEKIWELSHENTSILREDTTSPDSGSKE